MAEPGEEFVPTNPLEEELARIFSEDAPPDGLMEALAEAELVVLVAGEGAEAPDVDDLDDGTEVGLVIAEIEGIPHVPVFTAMERVAEAGADERSAIGIKGADLASNWPVDIPMALNPGAALGMPIPAEAVRALAPPSDGPSRRRLEPGTQIGLDHPVTEPEALLARVSEFAEGVPAIASAHRAVFIAGDGEPAQMVIGIELAEGVTADPARLVQECADAAGQGVAVIPIGKPPANPIDSWMVAQAQPFYRREP